MLRQRVRVSWVDAKLPHRIREFIRLRGPRPSRKAERNRQHGAEHNCEGAAVIVGDGRSRCHLRPLRQCVCGSWRRNADNLTGAGRQKRNLFRREGLNVLSVERVFGGGELVIRRSDGLCALALN